MNKTANRIITGATVTTVTAALGLTGVFVYNANMEAQAQAASDRIMSASQPAYEAAGDYTANLDALNQQSVEAKAAWDAEQARIAAEQAAAAAAAQAAAQAAAEEAARQAAAQQQAQQQESRQSATQDSAPAAPSAPDPVKCPAGTHANAVDANGNESACEQDGPNGEHCQAYDENNNCTVWLKE
jgi:hypothetical protein